VLRSIGDQQWSVDFRDAFLRRVCGTISEKWLRVLIDGRYIFQNSLLSDTSLSMRDSTRIVSAPKLERYLEKGATVVVRGAQSYSGSAFQLSEKLSDKFSCHVSCNLYIAEPNGIGFREHFDTHHLLVLQMQGSKTWLVSPEPETRSSKIILAADQLAAPEGDRVSFELNAGDMLYLPRGCWHKAIPSLDGSTHFSFGIHIPTRGEANIETARKMADQPDYLDDLYGFDGFISQ
jgi:Cupin superfamily protein